MKSLKNNIFFKMGIIFLIAILLLIPTNMIENLIHEREFTQKMAIKEVSSKWANEQTLSGPFISIPYNKYVKQYFAKDSTTRLVKVKDYIHLLPSKLDINGNLIPTKRHRGIYEIVVYNSQLNISGNFDKIDISEFDIPKKDLLLEDAVVTFGISDLRGVQKQVALNWNKDKYDFKPGTVNHDIIESGINSAVPINIDDSTDYSFNIDLDLKGSQKLYFIPVGEITDINIHSTWNNPSFNGAFLPDSSEISESGFKSNWNILHLNRNFPQQWIGSNNIESSAFGIDLLLPVDGYQKTTRSIKYAILFIALTFVVFFFVEILQNVFIHPIQYILVGFALVVFYTLLLSISEHINFNLSFILSAVATLSLIIGYVKAILKSNKLTILMGSILFILYTFIYVIIQLQDYSLLIGSVGIFIILSLVMYFSRKIDWYNLSLDEKKEG